MSQLPHILALLEKKPTYTEPNAANNNVYLEFLRILKKEVPVFLERKAAIPHAQQQYSTFLTNMETVTLTFTQQDARFTMTRCIAWYTICMPPVLNWLY